MYTLEAHPLGHQTKYTNVMVDESSLNIPS